MQLVGVAVRRCGAADFTGVPPATLKNPSEPLVESGAGEES